MSSDTKIQEYNLSKILKEEHGGKWIAISSDYKSVVAFSQNLSELRKDIGKKKVVYIKALPNDTAYAFLR